MITRRVINARRYDSLFLVPRAVERAEHTQGVLGREPTDGTVMCHPQPVNGRASG